MDYKKIINEAQTLETIQNQLPSEWKIKEQVYGYNGFYIYNSVTNNPVNILGIETQAYSLFTKIKLQGRSKRFVLQTKDNAKKIGKLAAEIIKNWELA